MHTDISPVNLTKTVVVGRARHPWCMGPESRERVKKRFVSAQLSEHKIFGICVWYFLCRKKKEYIILEALHCAEVQLWSRKNLHHTGGGQYWFSPPIYQQSDTLVYFECERTNQFTILYHQTLQEHCDWLWLSHLCPLSNVTKTPIYTHMGTTLLPQGQ